MLKINNVNFRYHQKLPLVLNDINLELEEGQLITILGKNGSGKTTLLKAILGLINVDGKIMIDDKDITDLKIKERAKYLSYLPQINELKHLSVKDVLILGRLSYFDVVPKQTDIDIVNKYVKEIQIEHLTEKSIDELSGGELQKVLITKALIQDTPFIILDEPTSSLDIVGEALVLKELKEIIKKYHKTVVTAIHDINNALKYSDSFVLLKDGKVLKKCDADHLTDELLSLTYDASVKIIKHENCKFVALGE